MRPNQYVVRLQIQVEHALFVQRMYPAGHLDGPLHHLAKVARRGSGHRASVLQHTEDRLGAKLHHEVGPRLITQPDVLDARHVVANHLRRSAGFPACPQQSAVPLPLGVEQLDRDAAVVDLGVEGAPHRPTAPASQLGLQAVATPDQQIWTQLQVTQTVIVLKKLPELMRELVVGAAVQRDLLLPRLPRQRTKLEEDGDEVQTGWQLLAKHGDSSD